MTTDEIMYIEKERLSAFCQANYCCEVCGKSVHHYGTAQAAHRVNKSKSNLKEFGYEVINHRLNLVAVCCLECNDKCNIGQRPESKRELIEQIKADIENRETWEKEVRKKFKDLIK